MGAADTRGDTARAAATRAFLDTILMVFEMRFEVVRRLPDAC